MFYDVIIIKQPVFMMLHCHMMYIFKIIYVLSTFFPNGFRILYMYDSGAIHYGQYLERSQDINGLYSSVILFHKNFKTLNAYHRFIRVVQAKAVNLFICKFNIQSSSRSRTITNSMVVLKTIIETQMYWEICCAVLCHCITHCLLVCFCVKMCIYFCI